MTKYLSKVIDDRRGKQFISVPAGVAFWAMCPIGGIDVMFRKQSSGGFAFDWLNNSLNPAILYYAAESDITEDHILIDGGRAVFADITGTWIAGQTPSLLRAEWNALWPSRVTGSPAPYNDPDGEAFGRACDGLYCSTHANDVPPSGNFKTVQGREEVRAFIKRIGAEVMRTWMSPDIGVTFDSLGNCDLYGQRIPASAGFINDPLKPVAAFAQRIGIGGGEAKLPVCHAAVGFDTQGAFWTFHARGDSQVSAGGSIRVVVMQSR